MSSPAVISSSWPYYSQTLASGGRAGALPGLELHYGALENLELDLVVALAFDTPAGGPMQRGYGDTEIDIKFQFLGETELRPALGFVPNFVMPTGNAGRGFGNGGSQIFLPLWAQKGFGDFSTDGGGYWFNNGLGNRNYWFFGWQAQYQISDHWILGGEIFHSTPQTTTQGASTGFSLGGLYRPTVIASCSSRRARACKTPRRPTGCRPIWDAFTATNDQVSTHRADVV